LPISNYIIEKILSNEITVNDLTDDEIVDFCIFANQSYRDGNPVVSDKDYDFIYLAELKKRNPNHPFLLEVEAEGVAFSEEKVLLPEAMLSIDKAYSFEEIMKWIDRIKKSCLDINFNESKLIFRATPKLDGFAGYDDGQRLYTRGDGKKGSDISRVLNRGLKIYNNSSRGQGAGEIVVKKSYFEKHLAHLFEFPRNFQASLIKEKELDESAKLAIAKEGAFFVPFNQLPNWIGTLDSLKTDFKKIVEDSLSSVDFDVDGVVFEVVNDEVKSHMGSNRNFIGGKLHSKKIKTKPM